MGLDAARAAIPARRRRRNLSLGFEARHPSHGAGDTDPETLGRRVARHPAFHHRPHNAFAKIVRKRHNRRLLRAAVVLNQNKTDSGTENDSIRSDAALVILVTTRPGEQPTRVHPLAPIPALELPAIRFFRNAKYL